jgi:hypothetical protein
MKTIFCLTILTLLFCFLFTPYPASPQQSGVGTEKFVATTDGKTAVIESGTVALPKWAAPDTATAPSGTQASTPGTEHPRPALTPEKQTTIDETYREKGIEQHGFRDLGDRTEQFCAVSAADGDGCP